MTQWRKSAGVLGASALLAATGACGLLGDGGEEGDDEARLVDMLNEGYRLDSELTEAEYRVVQSCLEAQGHTVHDQWEMQVWEGYEQETLTDYYPFEEYLPTFEDAEKWGFGAWSNSPEAWESGEAEEYQNERWGDEEEQWEDPDNSEFEALSPEEQFDWYVAFHGQEYADQNYGWVNDPEGDWDGGEAEGGEVPDDGELDLGGETYEEPKPGGCKLEMIEEIYGGLELVEEGEGGEQWSYWSWRPESPEQEADWRQLQADYRDKVADEENAFLDCVTERGLGAWEFSEYGTLPTWEYFDGIYMDEDEDRGVTYGDGYTPPELPEVPADLPGDFEGKKAYEIDVATGFAECSEETDYRDAAKTAWEEVQLAYYLALEEDMFAWQGEMRDAITRAQELIES